MDGLVFLIPIVAIGGFFTWMISLSPVGKAYAERLRRHAVDPEAGTELAAAVEDLRREVAELAERVDFSERLLARQKDATRLVPPDQVSG